MAALLLLAACADQAATETRAGAAAVPEPMAPAMAGTGITAQEDLVLHVGDRVFFDFDKSDLGPDAIETLNRQARWLSENRAITVTIEGHSDERGTRKYNLALGERRAAATKQYLESMGVDGGRIDTVSYGEERPAVLGSNEAAWAQNRRAVMVVRSGELTRADDDPEVVWVDDVEPGKPTDPGGDGTLGIGELTYRDGGKGDPPGVGGDTPGGGGDAPGGGGDTPGGGGDTPGGGGDTPGGGGDTPGGGGDTPGDGGDTPGDGGSGGGSDPGSGGHADAGGGNGSEIGPDGLDRDPGNSGNSRGRSRSND